MFERKDKFENFSDDSEDGEVQLRKKKLTGFQKFYAKDNGE